MTGSFTLPDTDTDANKMCPEPNGSLHRSLSLISMTAVYLHTGRFSIGLFLCFGVWQCKDAIILVIIYIHFQSIFHDLDDCVDYHGPRIYWKF